MIGVKLVNGLLCSSKKKKNNGKHSTYRFKVNSTIYNLGAKSKIQKNVGSVPKSYKKQKVV